MDVQGQITITCKHDITLKFMPEILKNIFIKCLYTAALNIANSHFGVALGCFVGVIFSSSWTIIMMQVDQDNTRAAALKNVEQQFIKFNACMDNQWVSCQAVYTLVTSNHLKFG
ncbi:hypothetical protein DFS33DRAFT_1272473 [Desarmillaria ectypa]|nr:hypothetical protein DFS33DRAFT_1272473 [Desarmillaria ectypa]